MRKCEAQIWSAKSDDPPRIGHYRSPVEFFTVEVGEVGIRHCGSAFLAKRSDEFHLLSTVGIGC